MKALEREVRELRQTNEILRKTSAYFANAARSPTEAMILFIDEHRPVFGIEPSYRPLPIGLNLFDDRHITI